jgi:hypothetical protein
VILTLESSFSTEPGHTAPESVVIRHGLPLPEGSSPRHVLVTVNHGRWIVRCPFCLGAQLASEGDHRFFCVDCQHRGTPAAGRWLQVVWPEERGAIENTLELRPVENRNWEAESVVELRAETRGRLAGEQLWAAILENRRRNREAYDLVRSGRLSVAEFAKLDGVTPDVVERLEEAIR